MNITRIKDFFWAALFIIFALVLLPLELIRIILGFLRLKLLWLLTRGCYDDRDCYYGIDDWLRWQEHLFKQRFEDMEEM